MGEEFKSNRTSWPAFTNGLKAGSVPGPPLGYHMLCSVSIQAHTKHGISWLVHSTRLIQSPDSSQIYLVT